MAEPEQPLAVKVGTVVLTFAAGWAAQKVVGAAWRRITGKDNAIHADDPSVGIVQATTFAAVSGGIGVLAQRLARQGAARAVARFFS